MAYYSDTETQRKLNRLERELKAVYREAYKGMQATANDYFSKLDERIEAEEKKYKSGKSNYKDDNEFNNWRLTQIRRGDGYAEMANELSFRMVEANQIASNYINGTTPSIYSLNHNYEAYKIEQSYENANFHLIEENTIKELVSGANHTDFKVTRVNLDKDYEWNSKQINRALTAGILQGQSIDKLADSYLTVMKRNRNSAVRNARTSVTSAQNAGRLQSYKEAEAMGIELEKEWIATLDGRTRDSHASLDGERKAYSDPFSNGLLYPADPDGAPREVYNCRCTMRAYLPKFGNKLSERAYKDETDHRVYGGSGNAMVMRDTTYTGRDDTNSYKEWLKNKKEKQENRKQALNKIMDNPSKVRERANNKKLDYKQVEEFAILHSKEEIIDRLKGGDMTSGSCASVAMAYMGNMYGYDVLDFKGGKSCEFFSRMNNIIDIMKLSATQPTIIEDYSDFKMALQLLKNMEEDKEYFLAVGRHASIVRKNGKGYEYLELQDENGGWTNFNGNPRYTLKTRFGCKEKTTLAGIKLKSKALIAEVGSLNGNKEFVNILGYINTNEYSQKKGVYGFAK